MNTKNILVAAGAAALGLGLIALPGTSKQQDALQTAVQEAPPPPPPSGAPNATARVRIMRTPQEGTVVSGEPNVERDQDVVFAVGDEGGSWLGVETREVTSEKAKELKLPAERGVFIEKVLDDGPAAKAGLKDGDVVTEINGQRVEGTVQFRRMIRETPAGRTLPLTVWRDGRSETINATLGKMQDNHKQWMSATPQVFNFRMPEIQYLRSRAHPLFVVVLHFAECGVDSLRPAIPPYCQWQRAARRRFSNHPPELHGALHSLPIDLGDHVSIF